MMQVYLFLNAALYIAFAVWCTLAPGKTASFLGLSFRSGSGRSEYITVYGGLEFGVAMFFLAAALRPELRFAGMLFAILFYGGLVIWRVPTLLAIAGIERQTYLFAAAEVLLLAAGLIIWFTASKVET